MPSQRRSWFTGTANSFDGSKWERKAEPGLFGGSIQQVALGIGTLPGDRTRHYELLDIGSSRLIDKWDGNVSDAAPPWAQALMRRIVQRASL
jgi:hypothetical protein